jgi:hypothetical protein
MPTSSESDNPQQWELLASPGHVLLAQVDAYRLKLKLPMALAGAALLLVYLTFLVAPVLASGAGGAVGWVTRTVGGWTATKPMAMSPAPVVGLLSPVLPAGLTADPAIVPSLADVAPEMDRQVQLMQAGKRTEDCDFNRKITQAWTDGVDMSPKCRYSADGKRLWVWALVKPDNFRLAPFAGVIAMRDGQARYYNLQVPGAAPLPNEPSINPMDIPRALAEDFPELVKGAAK